MAGYSISAQRSRLVDIRIVMGTAWVAYALFYISVDVCDSFQKKILKFKCLYKFRGHLVQPCFSSMQAFKQHEGHEK